MINKMDYRYVPIEDLIAELRRAGATWFKNTDLLALEEMFRRVHILLKDQEIPVKTIIQHGQEVSTKLKDVVDKADKVADEMNRLLRAAREGNGGKRERMPSGNF